MDPRRKPSDEVEAPTPRQQGCAARRPDPARRGGRRKPAEKEGELPEEDDDNAYQDSDDALPNDAEEAAIGRDPARRGGPFDEV
ncbi:hypothetical protein [Mesorhizobium neociceri]|uniref:Uncharacterized protein n=1 Tax=Mesorhizobium neociceri TaxID=1307853 RepID=A0A838BIG6_9HYPH|nr:hypothetical protein [Mesorhizobium neociceri]MBA1145264.1 hypothetical protein [Mesorhizobium neociceri]